MEENYGKLIIKVKDMLDDRKMNKNRLGRKAQMSWSQVDGYYNNTITRLDTYVLCKICAALECKIEDILEYVPASAPDGEEDGADKEEGR